MVLICGCSQKNKTKPIVDNIAFTAKITINSSEYIGDASIENSVINIDIKEPETIKGLLLSIDKNGIQAKFNGVSYNSAIDSLPHSAFGVAIYDVIGDIADKNVVYNDENCKIEGKVAAGKYAFVFSPTGLPLYLEFENIKIEFNNVSLK